MKVLHFISHVGTGGAERVLATLVGEQLKRGIDVACCILGTACSSSELLDNLVKPDVLNFSFSNADLIGTRRCRKRIVELVQRWKPNIVHSHLWPTSRIVEQSLRSSEIPHVVHIHDAFGWLTASDWRSLRDRIVARRLFAANRSRRQVRFIAVSNATKAVTTKALRLCDELVTVVQNGVHSSMAEKLASTKAGVRLSTAPLRIGMVGRLSPEKGQDVLLRAICQLKIRGVTVTVRFAGEGPYRETLVAIGSNLRLTEGTDFVFCGFCQEIEEFYRSIDVFALPSLYEGMPLVILEAMHAGLPIVASDVGGISEVVRDGVEGKMIAPGDSNALADAMCDLANDPAMCLSMGEKAKHRVLQHHSGKRMCDDVELLYSVLLSQR